MQASLYFSWEHHCFSVSHVFFCLHLVLNQALCNDVVFSIYKFSVRR